MLPLPPSFPRQYLDFSFNVESPPELVTSALNLSNEKLYQV